MGGYISSITGNLKGLKPSDRKTLERTFRRKVRANQLISPGLAKQLCFISHRISRQVGLLITRKGSVRNVIVGDAEALVIPEIGRMRGGSGRFRGLRLIHTHLKGESLSKDDLNDLALLRLDMLAMIAVLPNGLPGKIEAAYVLPLKNSVDKSTKLAPFEILDFPNPHKVDFDFENTIKELEATTTRQARGKSLERGEERAILISVTPSEEHLNEMIELIRAAGVILSGKIRQKRFRPHPSTIVGQGKLREIVLESMRRGAEVAIFDIDLRPAQARAFEDATGLKAIDRTQLILDIFAQRARSRDGKLQVELAQLRYSLPRLTEKDAGLSRLVGGIGGRGPGETVMEIGRRRVRNRIGSLEKKVAALSRQRHLRRGLRRREKLPVISIVGYTNAGKSSLINTLTHSNVEVADQLFMTLDPTSRRLRFPREGEIILTDTVGFLSDLPEELLKAFRATLEELNDADVLLHVADISHPELEHRIESVNQTLRSIGLGNRPQILILNKIDLLNPGLSLRLARRLQGFPVSALNRKGLKKILGEIRARLPHKKKYFPPEIQSIGIGCSPWLERKNSMASHDSTHETPGENNAS